MDIIFHTGVYTVNQALFKNLSTTKISESKHLFQDEYFLFGWNKYSQKRDSSYILQNINWMQIIYGFQ